MSTMPSCDLSEAKELPGRINLTQLS